MRGATRYQLTFCVNGLELTLRPKRESSHPDTLNAR